MPMERVNFAGVMCQFDHRKYPYFGSLESMAGESGRKLHCHRSHDFVASKISSQLNIQNFYFILFCTCLENGWRKNKEDNLNMI